MTPRQNVKSRVDFWELSILSLPADSVSMIIEYINVFLWFRDILQPVLKYAVILHEVFKYLESNARYKAEAPGELRSEDFTWTVILTSHNHPVTPTGPSPWDVCVCVSEITNSFFIFQVH